MSTHRDEDEGEQYNNGAVLDPLPPPRPRFVEMDELPHDATDEERNRAIASVAMGYNAHIPALHRELNEHRGGINHLGTRLHEQGKTINAIHSLLSAGYTPQSASLGPMRDKFASTHDVAKAAGERVAQLIDAETRDPRTPSPPPPAKVAEISAEVMQIAIDRVKAEQWDAREKERKGAETERLRLESENLLTRTRFKWTAIAGGITTALGIISWLVEHFSK